MSTIMIIDDEESICWGMRRLGEDLGHRVVTYSSAEQALPAAAKESPDVIVLDVRLPGRSGLDVFDELRACVPQSPVVVVTAYGDLKTAVTAIQKGAFDYIVKPFGVNQMEQVLNRAMSVHQGGRERLKTPSLGGLIGRSAAIQDVFKRVALVAMSDISVSLSGESGTGKELAARAIHQHSQRQNGPFVAVNIAALSPSLAESELFGHKRGSFTGADRDRVGLLERADGGTLFLDEVADIPLPTQAKLLRVIENKEIFPIGATSPVHSDFRIISASHQNLVSKVAGGEFRQDLFFRLSAFEIHLPALRDRVEDIPLLANYFLSNGVDAQSPGCHFSAAAMDELCRRTWPGNVRELKNAVAHAITMSRGGRIECDHLPMERHDSSTIADKDSLEQTIRRLLEQWTEMKLRDGSGTENLYERFLQLVECPLLQATIKEHHGQCAAAARQLGLHRTTLKKKLDDHQIS